MWRLADWGISRAELLNMVGEFNMVGECLDLGSTCFSCNNSR